MQVRFKVNLGSNDANRLGLKFSECTAGQECTVPDETGDRLVKSGIALQVAEKAPEKIKAIPAVASISKAAEPEIVAQDTPVRGTVTKSKLNPKDEL